MIFALKASRSPGLRDVITPWSTTTSASSHFAPALATSVLIDFHGRAPTFFVPSLDPACRKRHNVNSRAGLLQPITRHFEFCLFEAIGRQNCDFLAVQVHSGSPSHGVFAINHRRRAS